MSRLRSTVQLGLSIACKNRVSEWLTSNRVAQETIYEIINNLEYLQGIGAGGEVRSSGERLLLDLLKQKSRDNIIIDGGANVGEFSAMITENLDSTTIHLFEPQSACISHLRSRFETSSDIAINQLALANETGTTKVHYDEEKSGLASLTRRSIAGNTSFDKSEEVKTTTLDGYCKSNGIQEIDLLKLDIEGHELMALRGASELFDEQAIRLCSFEFGGANIDTQTYFWDFYRFFTERGYTLYRILPGSAVYRIAGYRELDEKFRTTNYVAVRSEEKLRL
jgi:FkbM family methyltransferase